MRDEHGSWLRRRKRFQFHFQYVFRILVVVWLAVVQCVCVSVFSFAMPMTLLTLPNWLEPLPRLHFSSASSETCPSLTLCQSQTFSIMNKNELIASARYPSQPEISHVAIDMHGVNMPYKMAFRCWGLIDTQTVDSKKNCLIKAAACFWDPTKIDSHCEPSDIDIHLRFLCDRCCHSIDLPMAIDPIQFPRNALLSRNQSRRFGVECRGCRLVHNSCLHERRNAHVLANRKPRTDARDAIDAR